MEAWGDILRGLREARGLGRERFAVELEAAAKRLDRSMPARESLIRMIRDWENGAHRPRDYYVLFIVLYASQHELAARTIQQSSELDRLMTALELMGVPMDRRKFLLNSAALTLGMMVEQPQERLSLLELFDDDPLSQAVGRLDYIRELKWLGEPAVSVYALLLNHAEVLDKLAGRFEGSDVERELRSVQARTLSDAGGTAFYDLGRPTVAEEHFRAGMQAAKRSSDPRLRAKLCVNLAHRRVFDTIGDRRSNLYDALWIANNGLKYAQANSFILTDVHDMRAFIYASLGNENAATEGLEAAATAIESASPGDEPEWLPNVSMAQVQETAGCTYLRMGKPALAEAEFAAALETRSVNTTLLHKSQVFTWAAQASANRSEPENGAHLLAEAIPVVSTSRSVERIEQIRKARAALVPWENEPFVRELDEQMRTLPPRETAQV